MKKIYLTIVMLPKTLSNLFSNVITLLEISQNDYNVFVEEIRNPNLKAISKYRFILVFWQC